MLYTVRSNAIRAARKVLGEGAQAGRDFSIDGAKGAFTWAKIEPAAVEGGAVVLDDPGERVTLCAGVDVQVGGVVVGPATVARAGDSDRGADVVATDDPTDDSAADLDACVDRAQSAPLTGDGKPAGSEDGYRETPEGQPTVADLVSPGALIGTNYGTGGRVVGVSRYVFRCGERELPHYTIDYVPADRYGDHKARDRRQINQCVAVGGRILKLFATNDDEVTVEASGELAEVAAQAAAGEAAAAATLGVDVAARREALLALAAEHLNGVDLELDVRGEAEVVHPIANHILREVMMAAYEAGLVAGKRAASAHPLAGQPRRRGPRKGATKPASAERGPNKRDIVAKLLRQPAGTTNREILDATGWPSVSVPAQARASNLDLRTVKRPGEATRYYGTPIAAAVAA